MSGSVNLVDVAFITCAIIFVATAFFRGFIKEVFSLVGWITAFAASYFLTPFASKFFYGYVENKIVMDVAVRSVIFIAALIIFSMMTSGLSGELKDRIPKAFDRSLGVLFGLIKTLVVLGFFYSLTTNSLEYLSGKPVTESSPQFPVFLKEARSHDLLKGSADVLNPVVKIFFNAVSQNFDQIIPQKKDDLGDKIDETISESSGDIESLTDTGGNSGYSKKDIEKMNHLIEIIEK